VWAEKRGRRAQELQKRKLEEAPILRDIRGLQKMETQLQELEMKNFDEDPHVSGDASWSPENLVSIFPEIEDSHLLEVLPYSPNTPII
jgi:hypothetical protein